MKARRRGTAIIVVGVFLFLMWIVLSPPFKKCVAESSKQQTEQASKKEPSGGSVSVSYVDCFGYALNEGAGGISALATLVIAFFTVTIWLANQRMAEVTADLHEMAKTQEKTARIHERAYIFGGGPWGLPEEDENTGEVKYSDTVHMTIQNYGRTIGFVTKVQWGLCPEDQFPKDVSVSKIIDEHMLPVNNVRHPDDIYPPTGLNPLPYRHITFKRSENYGNVFFGKIFFTDVFGDPHHSTFKLLITPAVSNPLPGCYSDDYK